MTRNFLRLLPIKSTAGAYKQERALNTSATHAEGGKEQPPGSRQTGSVGRRYEYRQVLKYRTLSSGLSFRNNKSESSGHSRLATLTVTPVESGPLLNSLSVEQLEQHLAERKLGSEVALMQSVSIESGEVSVVSSYTSVSAVVGHLDLAVEGVEVSALVVLAGIEWKFCFVYLDDISAWR